ncbi:MAG: AbrB/MazE/SpoVT family DNA-binding domain-containing protein [Candidatus Njordarchaeales archaeon]
MEEVVVTRKYQITIPKVIRDKLGIKIGDKLLVDLKGDKIIIIPIRASNALKNLATIADRILGGQKKIDAVKLVEESLNRETGLY